MKHIRRNTKYVALGVIGLIIALLAIFFVVALHAGRPSGQVSNNSSTAPAEGKPGEPNNPGDEAKSNPPTSSSSPSTSSSQSSSSGDTGSSASSGVKITQFTIEQPQIGAIHVNSALSGISDGTCSLTLTSPAGAVTSHNGSVLFDGHVYLCSFGNNILVAGNGDWKAHLGATSLSKASASADTSFKVNN